MRVGKSEMSKCYCGGFVGDFVLFIMKIMVLLRFLFKKKIFGIVLFNVSRLFLFLVDMGELYLYL